jgi:hypothetical protein
MRIKKDRPMTEQPLEDPVEYARALGKRVYLRPGELSFTELEISYLLSCLRRLEGKEERKKSLKELKSQMKLESQSKQSSRQGFDDNPHVRIRRHVLLYWEKSFYKSTILDQFAWKCCGGAELTGLPERFSDEEISMPTKKLIGFLGKRMKRKAGKETNIGAIEGFIRKNMKEKIPKEDVSDFYRYVHFLNLTGDIKRPVLKGSINKIVTPGGDKFKVVLPLMKFADIWIADELFDFLGENPTSQEASFLLNVLEGGRGKVAMVSMVGVNLDRAAKSRLRRYDIILDSVIGLMSYWCNGTFWGGTRPIFEKNLLKSLWEKGFFDRYVIVPWIPDMGEKEEMITKVQKSLSPFAERLYRINRVFWNTRFREIDTPPQALWNEAADYCIRKINNKAMKQGVDYSPNPRDALYCRQLLTVAALVRTVKGDYNKQWWEKAGEVGSGQQVPEFYTRIKVHPKLEYIPADFEWAKQYIDMYAENKVIFVKWIYSIIHEKEIPVNKYTAMLAAYGKGSKVRAVDIIKHIMKSYAISDRQAYRVLNSLEASGFVKLSGNSRDKLVEIIRQDENEGK